jgi:transcription initiation factor TFIIB
MKLKNPKRFSKKQKQSFWKKIDSILLSGENAKKELNNNNHDNNNNNNNNNNNKKNTNEEVINNDFCKTCTSILAVTDEGFLACTNAHCGRLYTDIVDFSAEWRFYAEDNQQTDPARCGLPINPLLEESSFGCKIHSGNKLSYEMQRIKRYTEWQATPYKEKQLYNDFQLISEMAQKAGVTKIIIDDALYYRKVISESDISYRGDNRDGIIAASIYLSCRKNNAPRSAQEIARIFRLDDSSATKGCKNALLIIQNQEKDLDSSEKSTFSRPSPADFLKRSCSILNMNMESEHLCMFVSQKIHDLNIMSENTPQCLAAGILYFVVQICKLPIEKKHIVKTTTISSVTITNCYKKLMDIKANLVPNVILQKYHWTM